MIGHRFEDAGKVIPGLLKGKPGQTDVTFAGLYQIPLKQVELHARSVKRAAAESRDPRNGQRESGFRTPKKTLPAISGAQQSGIEQPDRALVGGGGKPGIDLQGC